MAAKASASKRQRTGEPAIDAKPPTQALAVKEHAEPKEVKTWSPPAGNPKDVRTYDVMRMTVAYVEWQLPKMLSSYGLPEHKTLEEHEPLAIHKEGASGGAPTGGKDGVAAQGHKERWDSVNCRVALRDTGLYEAGGNVTWLDTMLGVAGAPGDTLVRSEPEWSVILSYAQTFFVMDAAVDGVSSATAGAVGVDGVRRIVFPGEALRAVIPEKGESRAGAPDLA